MIRRIFLTLLLVAALPQAGRASENEVPDPCMALLEGSQEALFANRVDQAEALARQGMAQMPGHPLPRLFLDSVLLTRLQEALAGHKADGPLIQGLFREADEAIRLAEAFHAAQPSPRSLLYLGGAYGARGLASLYLKHYLSSYFDGHKAGDFLHQAVEADPQLYNAYLGLGQFEYQSARLGRTLQWILAMPGDKARGLAMLETCAGKGDYASMPAKIFLARIYSLDEKNYQAAFPFVREILQRYPNNPRFVRYALATAKGLGQSPQGKELKKMLQEATPCRP